MTLIECETTSCSSRASRTRSCAVARSTSCRRSSSARSAREIASAAVTARWRSVRPANHGPATSVAAAAMSPTQGPSRSKTKPTTTTVARRAAPT